MLVSADAITKDRSPDPRHTSRAPRAAPTPCRSQGPVDESVRDRDPEGRSGAADCRRMGRRGREAAAGRLRRRDQRRACKSRPPRAGPGRLKVLDASVAVDMLGESARGSRAAAMVANERLIVPAHFDAEVYAAFRRLFRRKLVDRSRLDFITSRLIGLAAERVALPPLLPEVHRLADRFSAADAFYVVLARARRVELLTADAALARAASGLADVQLVRAG